MPAQAWSDSEQQIGRDHGQIARLLGRSTSRFECHKQAPCKKDEFNKTISIPDQQGSMLSDEENRPSALMCSGLDIKVDHVRRTTHSYVQ